MLRNGYVLGESAVAPVADALADAAAVLASCAATVALAAGVGEQRDHAVAGADSVYVGAYLFHHASDFVS